MRHVPDICLHLTSTGILDNEGYYSHFSEGKWNLTKGYLMVARVKKSSVLYMT